MRGSNRYTIHDQYPLLQATDIKMRVRCYKIYFIIVLSTIPLLTQCVNETFYKKCEQSGFCKRHRNIKPGRSPYCLEMNNFAISSTRLKGVIINHQNGVMLKLNLIVLKHNMLQLKVTEFNGTRHRYEAKEALVEEPKEAKLQVISRDSEKVIIRFGCNNRAVLNGCPFRVDIFSDDQLLMSANARGLMKFEHYRAKPKSRRKNIQFDCKVRKQKRSIYERRGDGCKRKTTDEGEGPDQMQCSHHRQQPPLSQDEEQFKDTLWEETFNGQTDTKPYGPASVGMDFSFVGFEHVYGIPEHADVFSLRTTKGESDPYRLFNLDVFEYDLNSPRALYGSIPFMVAHSETNSLGLFWLNAADTWVDIEAPSNLGVDFSQENCQIQQRDSHWFSESGNINVFFLLGPGPKDVMYQYSRLTGTTPLPPLFSLGYHQCRWSYLDQDDVRNVDASFDEHDIPYDVIWLDVDHTDAMKYFTWDPIKFSDPIGMINNLTAKGRKMVSIVDPHIKRDNCYYIYEEASVKGYFVKNRDNKEYAGDCWPGSSAYLDFLNPKVRKWWASKFALDHYQGSTLALYTWNDMNEPVIFGGPENTMDRDAKHVCGFEHRDVHNIYGMLMVMSTHQGHLMRANGAQRPFVLSRSAFAGSQRYAAVWTGDNTADWSHLRMSIPMILSFSISGMTFSGADVGGFFQTPEPELALRWYQAGAFQPFFRGHSSNNTQRREPWLFDGYTKNLIRESIRVRYTFLPFWYTLFYENEFNGVPPMRPIWMEFPSETTTFGMNDQYMIGCSLLVKPVLEKSVTSINIYFPGFNVVWYDIFTDEMFEGKQTASIQVTLNKIPVYQKGGTIIPKKDEIRHSSALTHSDPYSLYIALDKTGTYAKGTLFIDDFNSFQYRKGNYLLLEFTYDTNSIRSKIIGGPGYFKTNAWLKQIVIVGLRNFPKCFTLSGQGIKPSNLTITYDEKRPTFLKLHLNLSIIKEWRIDF